MLQNLVAASMTSSKILISSVKSDKIILETMMK